MKKSLKKALIMLLSVAMVFTYMAMPVYADDLTDVTDAEAVQEVVLDEADQELADEVAPEEELIDDAVSEVPEETEAADPEEVEPEEAEPEAVEPEEAAPEAAEPEEAAPEAVEPEEVIMVQAEAPKGETISKGDAIELEITNNTGMFKAVTASAVENEGGAELTFALSGTGYKWLYKGTYEEALDANAAIEAGIDSGTASDRLIKGETNADGKLEFKMQIASDEIGKEVAVVAISDSYYNNFKQGQNSQERAYYPRQVNLNIEEATLVTGDFDMTYEFALTTELADFKAATPVSVHIVGGPNSNNYKVEPTLVMGDATYDKVTFPSTAEPMEADLADGKFVISMVNQPNNAAFQDKTPLEFTFHVASDAPYEEAGTNVVRTVTFDQVARTIVVAGTPLTEKAVELADGTYTIPGLSTAVLSMYHFDSESARVVIKGDDAWLITSIDGIAEANTLKRFDGMAYGPQSEILDPSDETNHTLVEGTPIANVIEIYGDDGETVVGRTFVLPVPKSIFEHNSDIYYMIKYRAGYSSAHDGDWYKASGGDYCLTGYTLEYVSDSTDLPGEEPGPSQDAGQYIISANITKSSPDGAAFTMFIPNLSGATASGDPDDNKVNLIINEEGTYTLQFTNYKTSYPAIYMGTLTEGQNPDTFDASKLKVGVKEGSIYSYNFTIDASLLGTSFPIALAKKASPGSANSDWYTTQLYMTLGSEKTPIDVYNVIKQINALPEAEDVTIRDKDAIEAARAAYEALTDDQKAQVTNLDKLVAAEGAYAALPEKDEQTAAVETAIAALIQQYVDVNATTAAAVTDARTAYNALTAQQQAYIDDATYHKLVRAEACVHFVNTTGVAEGWTLNCTDISDESPIIAVTISPRSTAAYVYIYATADQYNDSKLVDGVAAKSTKTIVGDGTILKALWQVKTTEGQGRTFTIKLTGPNGDSEDIVIKVPESYGPMAEGTYEVKAIQTPSSKMRKFERSTITSDGTAMTVEFVMPNTSYGKIFLGTAEAAAAATDGFIEPTGTEPTSGTTGEGNVYSIPLESMYQPIAISYYSTKNGTWTQETVEFVVDEQAQAVIDAIAALNLDTYYNVTADQREQVNATSELYQALNDNQKAIVGNSNYSTLQKVVAMFQIADIVAAEIEELPAADSVTGADVAAIRKVKADFDGMGQSDIIKEVLNGNTLQNKYIEKLISQDLRDKLNACVGALADYSAVDAALKKVPEDLSIYTEESANALTEAVNAIDRSKLASEQEEVDAMATAIENAFQGLVVIPAEVTFTLNNKGSFAVDKDGDLVVVRPVTVTDLDDDKYLTYDEALVAAHNAYYEGGAEAGYACVSYVTKLWGVETSNTLFMLNGEGIPTGVTADTVKTGDVLYASVNADAAYYADWYTQFAKSDIEATTADDITVTLTGHLGMAYTDEAKEFVPLEGIQIGYLKDGEFKAIEGAVTDENGNATFKLEETGSYLLTAEGTVEDVVTDYNLMMLGNNMPPYGTMDFQTYESFVAYTEADYGDGPYPAAEVKYIDFYEEAAEGSENRYAWQDLHYLKSNQLIADCPIMAPYANLTVEQAVAEPVDVTLTLSNKGLLAKDKDGAAVVERTVTVTDLDRDGHLTVNEALVAAHDAYYEGGAEAGYATGDPFGYGTMVTKLWGVDTTNTLFYVNGEGIPTGIMADEIAAGDSIYASVNADDANYADWYTKFDITEGGDVTTTEDVTLTLTGHLGMAYTDEDKEFKPLGGLQIGIWKNGEFTPIEGAVTDETGKATFHFREAGDVIVTAMGTVPGTSWDGKEIECPTMAPYCSFKVSGSDNKADQEITATVTASKGIVSVGKTTTINVEGVMDNAELTFTPAKEGIVTVDANGKVTAKKVGTVQITVTAAETYNYNAATATVKIYVVPGATTSVTASNLATGMKVNWKKVTGATGYKVYRNGSPIAIIKSGDTVTYTDKEANTNGTKYTFKVVAYSSQGTSKLSNSLTTYRVSRPAISKLINSSAGTMKATWGKNSKATGYEIMYSTSKSFASGNKTITVGSASTFSRGIGGLTKGKTYYVKMRTYKTVSGKKYYSAWSIVKNVKITK